MIHIPDSLRADFQDACTVGFWLTAGRHTAVVLLVVAVWSSQVVFQDVRGAGSWLDALRVLTSDGAVSAFGVSLIACVIAALLAIPSLVWDRSSRRTAIIMLVVSVFLNPVVFWMAIDGKPRAVPVKVR